MVNDIKSNSEKRMQKCIETLKAELSKLRTGRAHPSLLEHIRVVCYGNETPLNQVASVSVSDARTLLVSPWDKGVVQDVEKAIRNADLGLNPVTAGQSIRVPLPPLTEERRKDLLKIVKQEGEQSRVAIRNIRRDANNDLKNLLKDKKISEDEQKRAEEIIQKLTDKFIVEVDKTLISKETELMEI
jgi:ribosome recycling factor